MLCARYDLDSPGHAGSVRTAIEEHLGCRVAYLMRLGRGMIPQPSTVLQENDIVNVLCTTEQLPTVERVLEQLPPVE